MTVPTPHVGRHPLSRTNPLPGLARLRSPSTGQFIGLVDQMRVTPGHGIGLALQAKNGVLELRGVADGDTLLHASVINQEGVTA